LIGQTLSHFEITAKLGEGGMGEVYRATDTKLGRDVAIKVLPEAFTSDPERLARFEREARVLASLNHPGIGQIYGLEEAGGVRALVLELVEGPTLAERIAQGRLPLGEALPIAEQIAQALAAAHAEGVIHRDLKPANVKVRPDGAVKVLDFGLAKALQPESGAAEIDLTQSPTLATPATQLGMILGTAPYMAPEQVEGEAVDARADLFAFGCVLYEMITAKRAFDGKNVPDTLSRILREEPVPVRKRVPGLPSRLSWLLEKCLAKSPADRYQGAGDLVVDLRAVAAAPPEAPAAAVLEGTRPRVGWAMMIAVGAVLGALFTLFLGRAIAPVELSPSRRFEILTSDVQPLAAGGGRMVAISRDGARIAYLDRSQLFIRDLASGETRPVTESSLGVSPFFSPDGDWLVYTSGASGVAKKVWADGGEPFEVCSARASGLFGGAWGPDDTIVLSDGRSLRMVGPDDTDCRPFGEEHRDPTHSYRDPQHLPGGEALLVELFESGDGQTPLRSIAMLSAATGELLDVLVRDAGSPRYLETGHLTFLRGSTIFALALDPQSGRTSGEPVPVVKDVDFANHAHVDVSSEGTLVYIPTQAEPELELTWVDRDGREEPLGLEPASYWTPRISPAGDRVAVAVRRSGGSDLFIVDPARATREPFARDSIWPAWTPDETKLAFASYRDFPSGLFWQSLRGGDPAERIAPRTEFGYYVLSVSENPMVFTFYETRTGGGRDILVMRAGEEPVTVVATPSEDKAPRLSADARYLAYATDTSGKDEVYVRTCPPCRPDLELPEQRWRLSDNGGTAPVWSRDNSEIFYFEGRKMMAVRVRTEPGFDFDPPTVLFESDHVADQFGNPNYDVGPDGRFIMIRGGGKEASRHRINVVVNWFRELRQRFETG
jgi:serine/threonine-protein kinase